MGSRTARSLSLFADRQARFLSDCGTPLFLKYDDDDVIRMTAGSLDRPDLIQPQGHYCVESRLGWADYQSELITKETKKRF